MNTPKPVLALDEQVPEYDDPSKCPGSVWTTRRHHDILYLAGQGPETAEIMVVSGTIEEEDAAETIATTHGLRLKQKPRMWRSSGGQMFQDVMARSGLDPDKCFCTALCRWILPRNKRQNPDKAMLNWGMPALMAEIEKVKPKIIVCAGKPVFNMLADVNINFADAHGCWFWSTKANAHIFLMQNPFMLVAKPEWYEMYRIDLQEVKRKLELINGTGLSGDIPVNMIVVNDEDTLDSVVARWHQEQPVIQSVDCEWDGKSFVDGELRTSQFAWTESDVAVFEFLDENKKWCFDLRPETLAQCHLWADIELARARRNPGALHVRDIDFDWHLTRQKYLAVGRKIGSYCDQDHVKYVGHHYAADGPWLLKVLGLKVYGKCILDTEFAQQCIDETSELKLERGIAMRYTTLGRYDMDLVMWKRANKKLCESGYGRIPRDILLPYSAKDAIAVYRAVSPILQQMRYQKLEDYWNTILCPFVTDGFVRMHVQGLQVDVAKLEGLRELFQWGKRWLEREFQLKVVADAKSRLFRIIVDTYPMAEAGALFRELVDNLHDDELWKKHKGLSQTWNSLRDHLIAAPTFNIRSADQIRRWLFDVAGLMPVKSTNRKSAGLPSMAWEKVLELPKDKQKLFNPAVDAQTLSILSQEYGLLSDMLDFNAVGNLCKAFLKEPETYIDDFTGEEVTDEAGLFVWIESDGRVHGNSSLTESGRTRCWNPNLLNLPKYVNVRIGRALVRAVNTAHAEGTLPPGLEHWVGISSERDLPSIRACFTAFPGQILTESDYKAAEMYA